MTRLLLLLISIYQKIVSPMIGPCCRFHPTCSEYAKEAIEVHGFIGGTWLAIGRVSRCHPLGGSGLDPVPSKKK
mgnify:CR=1 FL=1